jgi:hypothetical protein
VRVQNPKYGSAAWAAPSGAMLTEIVPTASIQPSTKSQSLTGRRRSSAAC